MKQSLLKSIVCNAQKNPDKAALISNTVCYTYSELYESVRKAAAYLKQQGVKSGDRVIITAMSRCEYIIVFLALHLLHAVTVPVERTRKGSELTYVVELTGASLYITTGKRKLDDVNTISFDEIMNAEAGELESEDYEVDENMLSDIIMTTGTTGMPKGAMHTEKAILCNTYHTITGIGMSESDIVLLPLPLQHSFGLRVLRASLTVGATVVLQNSAIFADQTIHNIVEQHCTGFVCVASSMEMLLNQMGMEKAKEVFGKLRYIEFSASAASEDLRRKMLELIPDVEIHNTWGSSETGGCIFINVTKTPEKIKSMGKPGEGIRTALYTEDGLLLENAGEEQVGRLALCGDMQMSGYIGQEELTKQCIVDGWYITSDIVKMDRDGYFYMVGRMDDIINCGGEKISPVEIEELACECEEVLDAACIGVEDRVSDLGQVPVLFLVAKESGADVTGKVKGYLSKKIAQYKMPAEYRILEQIPRNQMSKINRSELERIYNEK